MFIDRLRVCVLNGFYFLQREEVDDEGVPRWIIEKVEPAGRVRAGVYWLARAQTVEPAGEHLGQVIHADRRGVYQWLGRQAYLRHDGRAFEGQSLPPVGEVVVIKYVNGRAKVAPFQAQPASSASEQVETGASGES